MKVRVLQGKPLKESNIVNKYRPRTTEKQREASRKNILIAARVSTQNSELQRIRRLNQLKHEEKMADDLRKKGYEVFSPIVVCDRVAIKNEKVSFVEFKKKGQNLREGQQKIHDLCREMYLIIYA